jgi:glutaredoxin
VDNFNSRIHRLKETKAFNHTEAMNLDETEIIFDPAYLDFIKTHIDFIVRLVTVPQLKPQKEKPKPDPEQKSRIVELETLLAQKDELIAKLEHELKSIRNKESVPTLTDDEQRVAYEKLEAICADQQEKISQLETDQEDLFLCLADQELEIENLKERLKGFGEVFDEEEEQ